jgi:proteasome-associated ATPase
VNVPEAQRYWGVWARISGKKGERIVYIRTQIDRHSRKEAGRPIDATTITGQYL